MKRRRRRRRKRRTLEVKSKGRQAAPTDYSIPQGQPQLTFSLSYWQNGSSIVCMQTTPPESPTEGWSSYFNV
jgi:hypothetical protein